ncbi:MAG TPA: YceI family protein [Mycobacteriales bacterium]|nr:YceI family protein [Mycobacteriales bacterium]
MTATTVTAPVSVTGDYDLDSAHSRIGFAAKHAMVTTVRGAFTGYTATVHLDEENVANSSARIEIDATSIDTANSQRDDHIRGADFFEVEKYPTITFVSTAAEQTDDDTYVLTGDLTIRGISKPVAVTFEKTGAAVDPWGNFRVGFEGAGTINRTDWGVSFNAPIGTGGLLVSEKIKLEFDLALVRKA